MNKIQYPKSKTRLTERNLVKMVNIFSRAGPQSKISLVF
jgi:hypothetical protein